MARQIRIDQIAGLMEEEVQLVVKLTALEWAKGVKKKPRLRYGSVAQCVANKHWQV